MDAHRAVLPVSAAIAVTLAAVGLVTGRSVFGFESPFWDIGLLPVLAALVIGIPHIKGPRRRFVIGFEVCGALAVAAYIASCLRPARWSIVSVLLPFQTGFWLAPEMKTSWRALNPWGILADAAVLVVLPLLPALAGGLVASIWLTLRKVMVAVAVFALLLGAAAAYFRRGRDYDRMGQYHRSLLVGMLVGTVGQDKIIRFAPTAFDASGKPVTEAQQRSDAWHEEMARRYWRAARYPWVTVTEESPPD